MNGLGRGILLEMNPGLCKTKYGNSVPLATTNAVERRDKDSKSDVPQSLKLAMIKVQEVDRVACLKHISAEEGAGLSYRSRTEEARRVLAEKGRSRE